MSNEILRDPLGSRMGQIETRSNGVQIARDRLGRRVGEYDPETNVTRDHLGRRVGSGNLLAALLGDC